MFYKFIFNVYLKLSRPRHKERRPTVIKGGHIEGLKMHGNKFYGDMDILNVKSAKDVDFKNNLHYIPEPKNIGKFWNALIDLAVAVLAGVVIYFLFPNT